jgi:hypothetical protein
VSTHVSDPARRRALNRFVLALTALEQADKGDAEAVEEAIALLHHCLEWVTLQTWPGLWFEVQIARGDAYVQRASGDPLENLRVAVACYRAALCALQGQLTSHPSADGEC